jgi:ATP-dependent protease ClpP protease subunit
MKKCEIDPKFISIASKGSVAMCYIRGEFVEAELCADELTELVAMAESHSEIVMTINSPGGDVSTMLELIEILKMYGSATTIAVGELQSAAFILWMCGDVRVVSPYTSCMIHREGFGFHGKTNAHLDNASHLDRLYGAMLVDLVGAALTPSELEKAKYAEVYFTPDDLIERNIAISSDVYNSSQSVVESQLVVYDGRIFLRRADNGKLNLIKKLDIDFDTLYTESAVRYGLVSIPDDVDTEIGVSYSDQSLIDLYTTFSQNMTGV